MNCENCGHENAPASLICSACGRAIAAVTPIARSSAERRQVTALFCDLVDSVSLTVQLDPEHMMHIIEIYLAACDDIVAEHGGNVVQYMGDGVLAYFGYPRANEDDAANAIRAGLALRDAIGRVKLPWKVVLQARIGIATGLVVISDLIGHRELRGGGIVGETPNLAARLQSIGQPGSVIVADATRRVVGGQFTYRRLGHFSLKGFPAPVQAHEVVEELPIASRFLVRSPGKAVPLFGRQTELALLRNLWARTCRGQGAAALLRGEPGIGKSRMVNELRHRIANTSHGQLIFDCGPNTSDSALYPVTQQLARSAGFERGDSGETRRVRLNELLASHGATDPLGRTVIADLLGIPPDADTPVPSLTPLRRKEITFETLLTVMDQILTDHPSLIVVEDLHWSDSATLELLDRAVERAASRPWFILCTARPEFERNWPTSADVATIELGRLDRGNAEQICRHLGADALLPAVTVRRIVARCDGIPLFVEEMTKSVLEAVVAAPVENGIPAVAIPVSVRDSLVSRLDRLGSARQIACLGAAIGRRFRYDLLAAVAARPEASLRQDLRKLTRSGLVERSGVPPASAYMFKHALIRDAAYDSLLLREREVLHGRIAAVLLDRFPEVREDEPELLAYHFTESGAIAEAIPLWAEAGQRAASRAAHVEAVAHQQTALDLLRLQPVDDARVGTKLKLLIGLTVSLAASRGYSDPEVAKVLAEARDICDALGNAAELFSVLRGICNFAIVACDLAAAEETARRCLAIADQTGLVEHRIEADCAMGYILYRKGDLVAARCYLERAEHLYDEHDGSQLAFPMPHDPLCTSLAALEQVLYAMGNDADAERVDAKLIAHARSLGRTYDLAWTLLFMALFELFRGNFTKVLQLMDEGTGICAANGYALIGVIATLYRTIAAAHLGESQRGHPGDRAGELGGTDSDRLQERAQQLAWRERLAARRRG